MIKKDETTIENNFNGTTSASIISSWENSTQTVLWQAWTIICKRKNLFLQYSVNHCTLFFELYQRVTL